MNGDAEFRGAIVRLLVIGADVAVLAAAVGLIEQGPSRCCFAALLDLGRPGP